MSGQSARPTPHLTARPKCAAITSLVPEDSIRTLDWSSDHRWIVLGSDDGSLHLLGCPPDISLDCPPQAIYSTLLDPPNGGSCWVNQVNAVCIPGHSGGYCWLTAVTDHGQLAIFSVKTVLDETGRQLSYKKAEITEHLKQTLPFPDLRLAWSPDGKQFCLNGQGAEGRLTLWPFDALDEKRVPESLGHADGQLAPELKELYWSPRGDWLAGLIYLNQKPEIRLFEIRQPRGTRRSSFSKKAVDPHRLPYDDWNCLGFSPMGDRLGFGTLAGMFGWAAMNADYRGQKIGQKCLCRPNDQGLAHDGAVNCLDWSPDGRLVATGGEDGTILLWDTVHCQAFCRIGGFHESISALRFSPDGQYLVVDNNNDSTLAGEDGRLSPGLIELNVNPDEDPLYPHSSKPTWLP